MSEHRVLVIEDDAGARDALGSLLSEEGFRVRTAATGVLGLEIAREFAPHTVVCDFSLPGVDGLQVLRSLRAMRDGVFFIMLTANCGDAETERSLRREADLFLDKPVDLARFRAVLRERLGPPPEPLPVM